MTMALEVHDIVLSSSLWLQLRDHLLPTDDGPGRWTNNEQLTFILAAPNVSASRVRLVGHELLLAQRADLAHQSPSALAPDGQCLADAVTSCTPQGWSLRAVHSHPLEPAPRTTSTG